MMRLVPVSAVCLALLLPGCSEDASGPGGGASPRLQDFSLRDLGVVVVDADPGTLVKVWKDDLQTREMREECGKWDGTFDATNPPFFAYLKLWNRTGVVLYQEELFDFHAAPYPTFEVVMPADPPYLVASGVFCSLDSRVSFIGRGGSTHRFDTGVTNNVVGVDRSRPGEAQVALGNLQGLGSFEIGAGDVGIQAFQSVEPPSPAYGTISLYSPNATAGVDQWIVRLSFNLVGTNGEMHHYFTATPGTYPLHVTKEIPAGQPENWTWHFDVKTLTPRIAEYGFKWPMVSYVDCTHGTYEGARFTCDTI